MIFGGLWNDMMPKPEVNQELWKGWNIVLNVQKPVGHFVRLLYIFNIVIEL